MGVKSFLRNGAKLSLMPIITNDFQGRSCRIKWRGLLSTKRLLPGSGAQGSILGNLEYVSQTNNTLYTYFVGQMYFLLNLHFIILLDVSAKASYCVKTFSELNMCFNDDFAPHLQSTKTIFSVMPRYL